ncbi:MAG: molybdopterin-synthase adenylyltransferase MoeB [Akkermansiaceae bacterium]|nr:molybdopterin-synthase adenylyltransferase MoeB [Akkermansiaceae bacterium]
MSHDLSPAELLRYSRHLLIPAVGLEGQVKLKHSSVLLIGPGGLGSPAALYLAAAGVGRLGLVDPDVVDASNLQRQILHGESWIGKPKLDSAIARLHEINPHVTVDAHPVRFTPDNAMELAAGYDLLLDGCDNFPTRFLTNDTAFLLGKPLVYGAIHRFEGQVGVFTPHLGGPCYRCLLPALPPPGAVPSCAEAGVLGVLPGIIGSLQAMEAIKLILGIGTPPLGRLICYDALQSSFRSLKLNRDPHCRLCGEHPDIHSVTNHETTAPTTCATPNPNMETITTSELRTVLADHFDGLLIDVREPGEHELANIPQARLIPLATLPLQLDTLPRDREILVLCKAGGRSARAVQFLTENGFPNVRNVVGGMDAWLAGK